MEGISRPGNSSTDEKKHRGTLPGGRSGLRTHNWQRHGHFLKQISLLWELQIFGKSSPCKQVKGAIPVEIGNEIDDLRARCICPEYGERLRELGAGRADEKFGMSASSGWLTSSPLRFGYTQLLFCCRFATEHKIVSELRTDLVTLSLKLEVLSGCCAEAVPVRTTDPKMPDRLIVLPRLGSTHLSRGNEMEMVDESETVGEDCLATILNLG